MTFRLDISVTRGVGQAHRALLTLKRLYRLYQVNNTYEHSRAT